MAEQHKDYLNYLVSEVHMDTNAIQQYLDQGIPLKELASAVEGMIARGEDPISGETVGSENVENVARVFSMLDKKEKKIDGKWEEVVSCTINNFFTILCEDKYFADVYFNTLRGVPVRKKAGRLYLWLDTDDAAARSYIEKIYHIYNPNKFQDAFLKFQDTKHMDPVQSLINSVTWDGKSRIFNVFQKWLHVDDTRYNRECARLLFAGGISRAYQPGCKFDDVIVFQGSQGSGKSTFCQWLALDPELYNSTKTIQGQKGHESLAGKWIIELEELLATLANDRSGTRQEEYCKAFLSTQCDTYRKPYDRRPSDYPRHCIFIGTTNRMEFLTDKTGNRRWYPVRIKSGPKECSYMYKHAKQCKDDILQCWAEMKHYYDAGDQLAIPTVSQEMLPEVQLVQASAEQDDWRVGAIEAYLEDNRLTKVCIKELWEKALHPNDSFIPELKQAESNTIAEILVNSLGWERSGKQARFGSYGQQRSYVKVGAVDGSGHGDLLI